MISGFKPRVEQIFRLTKLDTMFNLFPSVAEAKLFKVEGDTSDT